MIKFLFNLLTGKFLCFYMSGGGSSGPTETKVTNTNLPDYAQPYAEKLFGQVGALTDTSQNPYQQYGGQRTAGFNPMQTQAFGQIQGMQPSQQGVDASNMAYGAGLGALNARFDPSTQNFSSQAAQQYMSPYMQNVVDWQKSQAVQDQARQMPGMNAAAVGQGAFGGNRQAIMGAESQRGLQNQLAGIQAQGTQQAYQQGAQQFNVDQARAQQSKQFGADYGMKGREQQLQASQMLGALGQQQYGQQMGINQAQQQAGGQMQALQQQGLTNEYQNFLDRQNYPYQQLGFVSNILRGTPIGQSATSQVYQAPPSMAQNMMGIGQLGLGMGSIMKGMGNAAGGVIKGYAGGGGITALANGGQPQPTPPDVMAAAQNNFDLPGAGITQAVNSMEPAQLLNYKDALGIKQYAERLNRQQARMPSPDTVMGEYERQIRQAQQVEADVDQRRGQGVAGLDLPDSYGSTFEAADGGIVAFADGGKSSLPVFDPETGEQKAINLRGDAKRNFELYAPNIYETAKKYNLDPALLASQLFKESSFKPGIVGNVPGDKGNSLGIAQFTPATAKQYGLITSDGKDLRTDPVASIDAAGRYMRDSLKSTDGDYNKALSLYNSGDKNAYLRNQSSEQYVDKKGVTRNRVGNTNEYVNTINAQRGNFVSVFDKMKDADIAKSQGSRAVAVPVPVSAPVAAVPAAPEGIASVTPEARVAARQPGIPERVVSAIVPPAVAAQEPVAAAPEAPAVPGGIASLVPEAVAAPVAEAPVVTSSPVGRAIDSILGGARAPDQTPEQEAEGRARAEAQRAERQAQKDAQRIPILPWQNPFAQQTKEQQDARAVLEAKQREALLARDARRKAGDPTKRHNFTEAEMLADNPNVAPVADVRAVDPKIKVAADKAFEQERIAKEAGNKEEAERYRNIGISLIMSGLGTLASKSPHWTRAVGEGGQEGLRTYASLTKDVASNKLKAEENKLRREGLKEDKAGRLALAERALRLQAQKEYGDWEDAFNKAEGLMLGMVVTGKDPVKAAAAKVRIKALKDAKRAEIYGALDLASPGVVGSNSSAYAAADKILGAK